MDSLQRLLEPLAAYPRWLVIACLLLAAIAAAWLVATLAKWAIMLAITVAVLAALLFVVIWLLG